MCKFDNLELFAHYPKHHLKQSIIAKFYLFQKNNND
jgi:hypothetical protein